MLWELIIKLDNLSHTYTDFEGKLVYALDGVSLTVKRVNFLLSLVPMDQANQL